MKNLKTLEGEDLLASDSYGLGVEKLWRISAKKKENKKLISDLGFKETGKLNKMFYEHEIAHGWAFLAFLLSGELRGYKRDSNHFLKDDAWLEFGPDSMQHYLEIEMGNHSTDRIDEKINRYRKHYQEVKQPLRVLFIEETEAKVEERIATFDRLQLTPHYQVALLSEIVENIFTARISNRQDTFTFAEKLGF